MGMDQANERIDVTNVMLMIDVNVGVTMLVWNMGAKEKGLMRVDQMTRT